MITLEEVFKDVKDLLGDKVNHMYAVETGCSFAWEEENLPYLSSPNIIKYLLGEDSALFSIDVELDRLILCSNKVSDYRYLYILNDSVDALKKMEVTKSTKFTTKPFRFFFLDSSEDEEHGLKEYELALGLLDKPGVICIDDYGCPNSVKWKASSEQLKKDATFYKEYKTPTGLIVGGYE